MSDRKGTQRRYFECLGGVEGWRYASLFVWLNVHPSSHPPQRSPRWRRGHSISLGQKTFPVSQPTAPRHGCKNNIVYRSIEPIALHLAALFFPDEKDAWFMTKSEGGKSFFDSPSCRWARGAFFVFVGANFPLVRIEAFLRSSSPVGARRFTSVSIASPLCAYDAYRPSIDFQSISDWRGAAERDSVSTWKMWNCCPS